MTIERAFLRCHPCPQAAELVTRNCEAYEAHMRDVRDYLEERLAVSLGSAEGGGQGLESAGASAFLRGAEGRGGSRPRQQAGQGWGLFGIRCRESGQRLEDGSLSQETPQVGL